MKKNTKYAYHFINQFLTLRGNMNDLFSEHMFVLSVKKYIR